MPSPLSSVSALDSALPLLPTRDLERSTDGSEAPFAGLLAQFSAPPPVQPAAEAETSPPSAAVDGAEAARSTSIRGADSGVSAGRPESLREPKAATAAAAPAEPGQQQVAKAGTGAPAVPGDPQVPASLSPGEIAVALPAPALAPAAPLAVASLSTLPPPQAAGLAPLPAGPGAPQAAGTPVLEPAPAQPVPLQPGAPPTANASAPPAPVSAMAAENPASAPASQEQPGTPRFPSGIEKSPVASSEPWQPLVPASARTPEPVHHAPVAPLLRPLSGEPPAPVVTVPLESPAAAAPPPTPRGPLQGMPLLAEPQTEVAALPGAPDPATASEASIGADLPRQPLPKGALPLDPRLQPSGQAGPTLMETPPRLARRITQEAPMDPAEQTPLAIPLPGDPAKGSELRPSKPGALQGKPGPSILGSESPDSSEITSLGRPGLAPVAPKIIPSRLGASAETPQPEPGAPSAQPTISGGAEGPVAAPALPKPTVVPPRSPWSTQEPVTFSRAPEKDGKEVQAHSRQESQTPKAGSESPTTSSTESIGRDQKAPEPPPPAPSPTHQPTASTASHGTPAPPVSLPVTQGAAAASLLPATPAAPAHPVVIQVGDSLKWILRQASTSAELQLHPENLGKVTIQLKVDGTEVHAKVWATEASTLPVLQDHRAYLEISLRQQGLHLGSFDLQQGHRGHQFSGETPSRPTFAPSFDEKTSSARQETPTAMASTFASSHRIEVLA